MAEGELLTNFINQFYTGGKEVPPEALISHGLPEQGLVEDFLEEMRGKNVVLHVAEGLRAAGDGDGAGQRARVAFAEPEDGLRARAYADGPEIGASAEANPQAHRGVRYIQYRRPVMRAARW